MLAVPMIINIFSRDFYGGTTETVYILISVVHILRGITPSIYVLLWIWQENIFYKISKFISSSFYLSLLGSCVFGSIYGVLFPLIFIPIFQLFWVSLSVPFVAVCLRKQDPQTTLSGLNGGTISQISETLTSIVILDVPKVEMSENNGTTELCAICLDGLRTDANNTIMSTVCHHTFHLKCILEWASIKRICPLCNGDLKTGSVK